MNSEEPTVFYLLANALRAEGREAEAKIALRRASAAMRVRPSLPGTAVASLSTGIELATQGGRLQSITSRE